MSDDPIKAALDACCMPEDRAMAAAAIAAFLRALPEGPMPNDRGNLSNYVPAYAWADFAAAVERAAQEFKGN